MNKTKIKYSYNSEDNNEAEKNIKINDMQSKITTLLNPTETSLKLKNIRIIIDNTYHLNMSEIFWSIIIEISTKIYNNHISIWKLCQLIHHVLNKGSPLCCYYGAQQQNINYLLNISNKYENYTGDKYDNYDICIIKYINLLIIKLKFHLKNQKIPTNLSVSKEIFEGNFGEDYDGLFQLAVEIFDYLDGIIDLQNAIFTTNLTYSIAPIMECRFMALSTLIEESKLLYFNVVQIMHNLHIKLPFEKLNDHRNRFIKIFKNIKIFYDRTIKLNLLQSIMWIPKMTDNPPEFNLTNIDIKLTNKPITIKENNQPNVYNNNVNELNNDENTYYDSDFDSSSDDDINDDQKNRPKLNRQNTLTGESPLSAGTGGNKSSLDILLQDKEETIRKLTHRIEILEQNLLMKDYQISDLKKELMKFQINNTTKNNVKQNDKLNSARARENGCITINTSPAIINGPIYEASNYFHNYLDNSSLVSQSQQVKFEDNLQNKIELTKTNKYPEIATKPLITKPVQTNNISRLIGIGTLPKQKQSDYQRSVSAAASINYGTIPKRINKVENSSTSLEYRKSVNYAEIKQFWNNNSTMIRRRDPEE